jgi:hypothetical protein
MIGRHRANAARQQLVVDREIQLLWKRALIVQSAESDGRSLVIVSGKTKRKRKIEIRREKRMASVRRKNEIAVVRLL